MFKFPSVQRAVWIWISCHVAFKYEHWDPNVVFSFLQIPKEQTTNNRVWEVYVCVRCWRRRRHISQTDRLCRLQRWRKKKATVSITQEKERGPTSSSVDSSSSVRGEEGRSARRLELYDGCSRSGKSKTAASDAICAHTHRSNEYKQLSTHYCKGVKLHVTFVNSLYYSVMFMVFVHWCLLLRPSDVLIFANTCFHPADLHDPPLMQ